VSLTTFLLFLSPFSQTEVSQLQSERDELTASTSTKDATLQVLNQCGCVTLFVMFYHS